MFGHPENFHDKISDLFIIPWTEKVSDNPLGIGREPDGFSVYGYGHG